MVQNYCDAGPLVPAENPDVVDSFNRLVKSTIVRQIGDPLPLIRSSLVNHEQMDN